MRLLFIGIALICALGGSLLYYRYTHPPVQYLYHSYLNTPDAQTKEFDGTIQMRGLHNTGVYVDEWTIVHVRTLAKEYPQPFVVKVGDYTTEPEFKERNGVQGFEATFIALRPNQEYKEDKIFSAGNYVDAKLAFLDRPAPLVVAADQASASNQVKLVFYLKKMNLGDITKLIEVLKGKLDKQPPVQTSSHKLAWTLGVIACLVIIVMVIYFRR
jgi:hypothetical protein